MNRSVIGDAVQNDRVRMFQEFLDPHDDAQKSYADAIKRMLARQERRLLVSLDDIRTHNRELADGLLNQPFEFLPPLDQALKTVAISLPVTPATQANVLTDDTVFYCALTGSFGEYAVNPRTLGSRHLNRMVSMEGIVTRVSLVRPKVVKSVHWNEKGKSFHFREYHDQTMASNVPASSSVYYTSHSPFLVDH
jgi:DNA replication licensing factor MCM3